MKIFLMGLLVLLMSCQKEVKRDTPRTKNLEQAVEKINGQEKAPFNALSGKILETMNASKYTYVLIDNGQEKLWIAGPMTTVIVGDSIAATGGMEMSNFESKTLKRVFAKIYFVSKWLKTASSANGSKTGNDHTKAKTKIFVKQMKHVAGETSVATIYKNKLSLKGKKVVVKGTVVKFLTQIMGKNWIHIQDGSSEENDDLTITTSESVQVGDIVKMEGTLAVDKDFGYGYLYAVILEEGKVLK